MAINVNGYTNSGEFNQAGNGEWAFVVKDGVEYFMKRYPKYVYPSDAKVATGNETFVKRYKKCEAYKNRMEKINTLVNGVASVDGNVVIAIDFFRYENKLYKINRKITPLKIDPKDLHKEYSVEDIDRLMVSVLSSMKALHNAGLVHCDLKDENIFIDKDGDKLKGRVSDFDDSFIVGEIPDSEDIVGTPQIYSPELGVYIKKNLEPSHPNAKIVTTVSDIFSLGILYHVYLTGEMPLFDKDKYSFLFEADNFSLSSKLDKLGDDGERKGIIKRMLDRDYKTRTQSCAIVSDEIRNLRKKVNTPSEYLNLLLAVRDTKGEPIKGAIIKLIDGDGSEKVSKSNAKGVASFAYVKRDKHQVCFDANSLGFEIVERPLNLTDTTDDEMRMPPTQLKRSIVTPKEKEPAKPHKSKSDAPKYLELTLSACDAVGNQVRGVIVTITDDDGDEKVAKTNAKGVASFEYVQKRRYKVRFDARKIGAGIVERTIDLSKKTNKVVELPVVRIDIDTSSASVKSEASKTKGKTIPITPIINGIKALRKDSDSDSHVTLIYENSLEKRISVKKMREFGLASYLDKVK